MKIVIFTHPNFLASQSMPRFASMIIEGMKERGHEVSVWTACPFFYNFPVHQRFKKWLGYLDQFIVFPIQIKLRIKQLPADTLFVFTDQALGPWVPSVSLRPHVIHVHDFMALRSALGEYPQNKTGWMGKQYQAMIRRGFAYGKSFISVSQKTQNDLERFLPPEQATLEVVYNGLNFPFRAMPQAESVALFPDRRIEELTAGFLMHIGGNQWYKNRVGVLELYEAYAKHVKKPLPLWMVGAPPTKEMNEIVLRIGSVGTVIFLSELSNDQVCAAYSLASLFIFPSLAEGFGWPIAEAMACGCLVITTGEAPMTEVGGEAAFYIANESGEKPLEWENRSVKVIEQVLALTQDEKQGRREKGFTQAAKFDAEQTLKQYEHIYQRVIEGGEK